MRVTSQMMSDNAVLHMQDNLERLSGLQQQIASGKRIQNPSDDPALAVTSLNLRSTLRKHEAYLDTARTTRDWLDANELAFKQFQDIAARAIDLVRLGLSDTQGADQREAMATEMEGLLEQSVEVANTSHRGSFIFAGYKTTPNSIVHVPPIATPSPKPFELVTTPPATLPGAVSYGGDAGVIQNAIDPSQQITINLSGQQVVNGEQVLPIFFQRIIAARDQLTTLPKNTAALQAALTGLATSAANLTDYRTTNGARVRQVDQSIDRMEQTDIALKNLLSHQEDVNMARTISDLKQQETVYQTVLQVGARALPPSLFDFLR